VVTYGFAQDCPILTNPTDGSTNVPVTTTITWTESVGVPGYSISIGTTPGGTDIINNQNVGSATSFTPPLGLPENTLLYVTITLVFFNQANIVCDSQSFTTEDVTTVPPCTNFTNLSDGDTEVSVFTNISWSYSPTATSYVLSIGTAPGLGDVLNGVDVGNVLSYTPPTELDPETEYFIEVVPINENGQAIGCDEISFTTDEAAVLPGCTQLISPENGATNVPLTPLLEWEPVAGATGYRVSIGSTPGGTDVLDNALFFTNSTLVLEFDPNQTFFITIVPFNDAGNAIGCTEESFSTLLGCGPFLDADTGEFITLNPNLEFPEVFSFCENADPLILTAPPGADGYRWFQVDEFGFTQLLSEDTDVTIQETGEFYLEAYNNVSQTGGIIECTTQLDFSVVSSEVATIDNLIINDTALGLDITVEVSGTGDYEYAIDNIDGPYQDSNVFRGVTPGTHTIYVRDKNGCGIVEETFEQDLTVEGFPTFFTPNGDTINDFWQFVQPIEGETIILLSIEIFDRYGKLLQQIDQNGPGWDGTYNGRDLPSGGYWYRAVEDDGDVVHGNFTLKR